MIEHSFAKARSGFNIYLLWWGGKYASDRIFGGFGIRAFGRRFTVIRYA